MNIRTFRIDDEAAVIELWRQCDLLRPQNDPKKDIARKLRVRPDQFLVGEHEGKIAAACMVGYDGHRGWIYYLGVAPEYWRNGFGRELMAAAEALLRAEGCPKINLQVRTSNTKVIAFYQSIGFAVDDVMSMGKRLEFDTK